MQGLDVAPASLETVSAALRVVHDGGATRLAAAIVADVTEGLPGSDPTAELDDTLPRVVELIGRHTAVIADRLAVAAGAYRRADWVARVAMMGGRS